MTAPALARFLLKQLFMLDNRVKWKLVMAMGMAIGGSFVAGCCGGPGANGGGCAACAQAKAALGANEAGADPGCAESDASSDANPVDSGPD